MNTRPEELLPVTEMAELMLNEPSYGQEAPFNVPLVLRLAPTTDPDRHRSRTSNGWSKSSCATMRRVRFGMS